MNIHFFINKTQQTQPLNFTGAPKLTKNQLEKCLILGMSVQAIALKYKISPQKVYALIRFFELKVPTKIKTSERIDKLNRNMPRLIQQGKTIVQITKELGVAKFYVEKWIKMNLENGLRPIKEKLTKKLLMSELSNKAIAQQKGVSSTSVSKLRTKYGVSYTKMLEQKKLDLIKNALNHAISFNQIAKETNLPPQVCSKYIKKYGLQETLNNNLKVFIQQKIACGTGKYSLAKEMDIAEPTLNRLLKKLNMQQAFDKYRQDIIRQVTQQRQNGITLKQIAKNLGISKRTVTNYLKQTQNNI